MKHLAFVLFFLLVACGGGKDPQPIKTYTFYEPRISATFSIKETDKGVYVIQSGGTFSIDGKSYPTDELRLPVVDSYNFTQFELRHIEYNNQQTPPRIGFGGMIFSNGIEASGVQIYKSGVEAAENLPSFTIQQK